MVRKWGFVVAALFATYESYGKNSLFTKELLPSGLELVSYESHKVPLVTIVLCSKAGAMTEDKDTDGLTHLWEHMFFKGNKKIPNQEAFNLRIQELGIVYNGDTSAEKVRYYFTMPSVFLEEGLEFMRNAITEPLLAQEELEREVKVVLDEWDRNASSPGFDLYRLRDRLIYGDLYYLRDPLGDRDLITKTTREQLLRIKKEVFVPSNSALLVAGDFDPKKLKAMVQSIFKDWQDPKGWQPKKIAPPPPFPEKSQIVVMTKDNARNVAITHTFPGPKARTNPEPTYAADVLAKLLNMRTSKFYQKFIDSGLTLSAGMGYYTQSHAGEINLYAQTTAKNTKEVLKLLEDEPKNWLAKDYFSKDQLEDVKRQLKIERLLEGNRPSSYAKTLAFWWAITGLDYYESYNEKMLAVSLQDIHKFLKDYMIDRPALLTIFLSPSDAKAIGLKDNSEPLMKKLFKKES